MFGEDEELYVKLMSMIKEYYLKSADPLYCSLKLELTMAAHEVSSDSVVRNDPAHELAWCLDTCMRDKHIDAAQSKRLHWVVDGAKKLSNEVISDVAMMAADPHVVHLMCTIGVKLMRDTVSHVPRDQKMVQCCNGMCEMPSPNVDAIFFTKFLPSMAALIIEDVMRVELAKNDKLDEAEAMGLYTPPSETIATFLKTEPAAALLWIHYTLDLLPRRTLDIMGMLRYLRLVPMLKDQVMIRCPWSHLLMHRLVTAPLVDTLVNDAEFVGIIMDRLFLSSLKMDLYLKYQLLRLVSQLHRSLHPTITAAVLEHIAPEAVGECPDAERYGSEYARITTRMARREEEKTVFMMPAVPQPAPVHATPARVVDTPSHNFDY